MRNFIGAIGREWVVKNAIGGVWTIFVGSSLLNSSRLGLKTMLGNRLWT